MKIIIADPDPDARKTLTEVSLELGFEPVPASGRKDILQKFIMSECSVLLLDISSPGIEGTEFCREIRKRSIHDGRVCYVIVYSSTMGTEEISRCLRAGADDFVYRKTDPAELKARISVGVRTAQLEKKLIDLNNRLKYLVRTDSLTGLLNHSAILKELSMELERARRDGSSTSILMIDLDRFKMVNDTHGHQTGDRVLIAFSNHLCRSCRSFDRIGRYGGEEFMVILPRTDEAEALSIGERIREGTESLEPESDIPGLKLTCSIGCCSSEDSDKHPSSMVAAADSALFRAKEAGRNRVVSCN